MAEMLVQSHLGEIHLLPALPKAWKEGSVQTECLILPFKASGLSAEYTSGSLKDDKVLIAIDPNTRFLITLRREDSFGINNS